MYISKRLALLALTVATSSVAQAQFSNPIGYEPAGFSGVDRVIAADVDGDGDIDAVCMRGFTLFLLKNTGNATFQPAQTIASSIGSAAIDVADISGDGVLDIVVALPGTVTWRPGLGGGLFGAPLPVGMGIGGIEVLAMDFDQDGDIDVVTQNAFGIASYENIGFGSFLPEVNHGSIAALVGPIQSVDLNGDGFADVIYTGNTSIIANYGSANGLGAPTALAAVPTVSVAVVDIDADSIVDLSYVDLQTHELVWRPGVAGGSYGPAQLVDSVSIFFHFVSAADVDGDGDQDLLDFGLGDPFRWYENDGSGTFAEPRLIQGGRGLDLRAVDLNGDQSVDLISTGNDPALWLNGMPPVVEYCQGVPNSTGVSGVMGYPGSSRVLDNSATLTAQGIPLGTFGIFITSRTQGFVANPGGSQGNICLAGGIGRFSGPGQIVFSGGTGTFNLGINLFALPTPNQTVFAQPGETWNFQAWHRDAVQGQTTSNFTSAVSVLFY